MQASSCCFQSCLVLAESDQRVISKQLSAYVFDIAQQMAGRFHPFLEDLMLAEGGQIAISKV